MKNLTTILIVDDSLIFRKIVQKCLDGEDDIKVIGSVRNGVKAMEFIRTQRPDLITLDIEMPEMNGIQTLQEIQRFNSEFDDLPPIGVIMLSAFTKKGADITIKALERGAFDFITKPEGNNQQKNFSSLRRQLLAKIRYFTSRRIASRNRSTASQIQSKNKENKLEKSQKDVSQKENNQKQLSCPIVRKTRIKAILIGVSTGGPRALMTVVPELCQSVDIPILIVQHMPPKFTESLAESLNSKCRHNVLEAKNDQTIEKQHVYIAPGGKHMVIGRKGAILTIKINEEPPEHGCRPSVDVLFRSAEPILGGDIVAVILTGMGTDGTNGLSYLKQSGAYVVAQDEATSVVWGMPGSAVRSGFVDEVQPLEKISECVVGILQKRV